MLDAALDHLSPYRLGYPRGKALSLRRSKNLGDDVFDPPFDPDVARVLFDAGGGFDEGLPLRDEAHQLAIDLINAAANVVHCGAVAGAAARILGADHAATLGRPNISGKRSTVTHFVPTDPRGYFGRTYCVNANNALYDGSMTVLYRIGDSRSFQEVVTMVAHTQEFPFAGSKAFAWKAALGQVAAVLFLLAAAAVSFEVMTFDAGNATDCLPDICTLAG